MRPRNWLRSFRKAVRPLLRPARRWVWSPHEIWKRAILHEVAWWDHYLAAKRDEGYVYRTDPDAVLRSPLVIRALERMGKPDVAILDVGAGALTNLGKTYPGYRLRIIAVDPLADHYDELLRKHSVSPPVRTIRCEGERLLKRFDRGAFDIAHANNALDHAYNPVRVILALNRSSQHCSFELIVGARRGPRRESASRGSCAGGCSTRARRRRYLRGGAGAGRCPSGSTGAGGRWCSRSSRAATGCADHRSRSRARCRRGAARVEPSRSPGPR